jgi:hypothetical protein
VTAGEVVEMVVTIPEQVSGFQWTLETDGFEFEGLSSEDIAIGEQHVGLVGKGIVTMSWNGTTATEAAGQGDISFVIRWKATASGRITNMIHLFMAGPIVDDIRSEAASKR